MRALAALLLLGCASAPRPSPMAAFQDFVSAFNARDLARFMDAFEPGATVFFDLDTPGERVVGRDAVRAVFAPFFHGRRPLKLEPVDVQLQRHDGVALVTFHLRSPGGLARRTLVWRYASGRWRVWHLHASSVDVP